MTQESWVPHPDAITRQKKDASDKSESLAIEILKLAVGSDKAGTLSNHQIVDRAELMWLWATTDTWPKPEGAP